MMNKQEYFNNSCQLSLIDLAWTVQLAVKSRYVLVLDRKRDEARGCGSLARLRASDPEVRFGNCKAVWSQFSVSFDPIRESEETLLSKVTTVASRSDCSCDCYQVTVLPIVARFRRCASKCP